MLSADSRAFLNRLLDAPGPSGFESLAAQVWREEASTFATVTADVAGNSMATVSGNGGPTIMIAGHIDEIGVIVTYIDDDGFAYIAPIGGWDPQVLVGQRLRFLTRGGDVFGVVGSKPIHFLKSEEREKAVRFPGLWVDIGAESRADAESRLAVGDPAVIDARIVEMPNGRIVSRAIDDRIGAFIALETLRAYAANRGTATVSAVATTQEEIGYHGGGALVAAVRLDPAMAIAVDVTPASDHPQMEKKEVGDRRLGSGPVIARGSVISPVVFALLRAAAERLDIPFSVQAVGRDTNTDADFITIARNGVATALVSVPDRYLHTPNEMVSLGDLEHTITLLAECCRAVTPATDFAAR
jgi:putative aminopeptidase FrvX